jgi:hypothetical protein
MDLNNDGTLNIGTINSRTRYGNAGASTMPYAQIDTGGRIFMLYSALTEDDLDGQSGCFRDVYITFSKDNGANWSVSRNLTGFTNFNQEEMFGSVASLIQDKLNITYMISNTQGFYSSADNPTKLGPFDIVHYVIPVKQITDSTVGVYENNTSKDLINIGQNYPNPFSGKTIIPVEVKSAKDITVKISNIVGQEVYSNVFSHIHTGVNHLEVDAASLTSGVYFYTVHVNGESITNKMIVE